MGSSPGEAGSRSRPVEAPDARLCHALLIVSARTPVASVTSLMARPKKKHMKMSLIRKCKLASSVRD